METARLVSLVLVGFLHTASGALAADEGRGPGAQDSDGEGEDSPKFLTGLDFSYWASEEENTYGPGLSWGLVLLPRLLEMQLTAGAMIGSKTYTIPVELRFSVPFELARWLDLFVSAGPTMLFDRVATTWEHDFAASVSLGLEIKPPGFEWGLRLQGDYNLRLWKDVVHTGGFTAGFLYRF